MPKPSKHIIIDSIVAELEKGAATEKICAVICSKFQFTERTFYNHFKTANKQHVVKQEGIKKELVAIDTAAAVQARKRAIMTAEDRKEYLTKIILGEVEVMQTQVRWDRAQLKYVTVKLNELAGHTARISAIAELNKMEGDYSPMKIAQTDKEGNNVAPMIVLNQFMGAAIDIKESE